ncbi:uncharacterized protein B0H18DRAFT_888206, partial [Fomitopsis serialis]|uniref:uncharacterized protein n=1 Tax=Fomitopsis serialis TaxID=139415 RepID=UPI002007D622
STKVWRDARANFPGLPACPPYMSEPVFASLLFDVGCMGCGALDASRTLWEFCRRYCERCQSQRSVIGQPSSALMCSSEHA